MEKLTNWTAKRAGGRITINAQDKYGQPRKVVGVDTIEAGSFFKPGPIATDRDGVKYRLAV